MQFGIAIDEVTESDRKNFEPMPISWLKWKTAQAFPIFSIPIPYFVS